MRIQEIIILIFGTFALIVLSGCRQSNRPDALADLEIGIVSPVFPPLVGEDTIKIKVVDQNNQPVNDLALNVKGDMTHAGMEPVLADVIQGEDGIYEIPFEWTMGGDWVVSVEAEDDAGDTTLRRFDLFVDGELPICGDDIAEGSLPELEG